MADYKLIGKNYTTTDLRSKVTGRAKYAEDFRAEPEVGFRPALGAVCGQAVLQQPADLGRAPRAADGWAAANIPDPFNPVGVKGIGEPAIGAGSGSVLCAIADALGGDGHFFRSPVSADMVLTKLEQIAEPHDRLMSDV